MVVDPNGILVSLEPVLLSESRQEDVSKRTANERVWKVNSRVKVVDPVTGKGRYIFYNVGPLVRHGKLDVISLGSSANDAEDAIHEDLPRRLGL